MNYQPDDPKVAQGGVLETTTPGGDSTSVETCAGCGQPVKRRGLKGECLRCLLGMALPADQTPPTAAEYDAQRAANQLFHYGHFEVAVGKDGFPVELGSGGMATTYRAYDTVLHSSVALKVINDHVLGHPQARTRFLREARAAAKLHHPNVAGVTFYGEQDGECYYAMELVEGETLEALVRREGPLPPALVLAVGVQVAQALTAAEACGLVHRDLKPSNIMLAARPEDAGDPAICVKVIDWGLAKAVGAQTAPGADETRHGFVGTPAFASPEQFARANERHVDLRSDIYSLGLTLWYLLCGRAPFVGGTLEAIQAQRGKPPFEQLTAVGVPKYLVEILRNTLAPDPARRPQSAHELLRVLRDCQAVYDRQATRRVHRHRQRWLIAAAALFAVTTVGVGVWWRPSQTPATPPDRSIAVLPFENLSSDKADAFFTAGMQEEITGDLARAAQLKVISTDSTRAFESGKFRDYAAIGRTLGVQHLLEGSVRRADGKVRIAVRLVDTNHPGHSWNHSYAGPLQDVFAVQSDISHAVATQMQTVLSTSETISIERPLTTDPEAHDLYLRAMTMAAGVAGSDQVQSTLQQVALFEAAVARDPNFAAAYRQLAGAYNWLYENRDTLPLEARGVDHHRLGELALAKARQLDPDNGDFHLAAAESLLRGSHNYAQAQVEIDLARRTMPNNPTAESLAGEIAYCQGHWREALRAYERAVALNPMDWGVRLDMAHEYRHLRYFAKCDRELAQVIATVPAEHTGQYKAARASVVVESRADLAPLRDVVASLSTGDDPTGRLRFRTGFLLHFFERDAAAAAKTLASYPADPIRGGAHLYPRVWFEAQIAQLRGDTAGAAAAFTAVCALMTKQAAANPDDGWTLSMLAVSDAALGHGEAAVREAQRAVELEPYERDQTCATYLRGNLALVYAQTGQINRSLDVLEALVDKPGSFDLPAQASYGDLRLNPCWDCLRGNPRFEALVPRFAQPLPGL